MCLGWGDTNCIRHIDEETTWKTKEEIGGYITMDLQRKRTEVALAQ